MKACEGGMCFLLAHAFSLFSGEGVPRTERKFHERNGSFVNGMEISRMEHILEYLYRDFKNMRKYSGMDFVREYSSENFTNEAEI